MSQDLKKPQLALKDNSLTFSAALLADFIPLLSAIFQDSPDCVAIYDIHARVHYANKSLEGTWGYSLHHAQNAEQTNSDCFKPFIDALNSVLSTGLPNTFLLDCKPSYMLRHIHDLISMTAIKNQHQTILGVIAIGRNLDDYCQTQHQLLAQKERYQRALIDNFPFMVWLKDVDSRFLAINNAYAQLIGVTCPEEVIGKTDYDYFPKANADSYVIFDHEVMQSGESKVLVESIMHSSGKVNWAEVYKSPVIMDGVVVGTVGFARDLSEFKKLQEDATKSKTEYIALVENLPLIIAR